VLPGGGVLVLVGLGVLAGEARWTEVRRRSSEGTAALIEEARREGAWGYWVARVGLPGSVARCS